MSTYVTVEAPTSVRRSFAITVGLAEGYGANARRHDRQEVIDAALGWMKQRVTDGKPYLSGTVSAEGTVAYAYAITPGNVCGDCEDVVVFFGEVSVLYNANLTDGDVKEILNDMAAHLGTTLRQTRVYVAYRDEAWVLQATESATPTGETMETP